MLKICLESLKWVDEIVIIDDNSTTATLDIARSYTDKIVNHKMEDFASQRNFAMSQTSGEWVLFIDPDERVTKELRREILTTIAGDNTAAAAIPRRNFFLGQEQKFVGGWPDYVIRLLKKQNFDRWEGVLHEQPRYSGQLIHLKNPLIHLTHTDITSMTQKTLSWSHLEAKLRFDASHPKMESWRFFRICISTFFDWYIKKGGYKAGVTGTIESLFQTFSVFFTYVRLWEMQQDPSLEKQYQKLDDQLVASDFTL